MLPAASPPPGATAYAARLSAFYAALFLVMGVALPYLPTWYSWRGLSIAEIALIATVSPLVRLVAVPSLTILADRRLAHRFAIIACAWAGLAAWVLLAQAHGFWPILAAAVLVSLTGAALLPLTETLAMAGVRAHGLDYGRMRLWGSVSFIIASLGGGWFLTTFDAPAVMWLLVGGAALAAFAAHLLPMSAGQSAVATTRAIGIADLAAWARTPALVGFLLAVAAVQGSYALFYLYGVLHWRGQGISSTWCGALWAIAVIVEVAVFWFGGTLFRKFGPISILTIGALSALVRWFAMAFDPPLEWLIGLQMLHGVSFAATQIGAMQFLARAVTPHQAATAQGVFSVVTGSVAMMIANQIAGFAYGQVGSAGYVAMAMLVALGLGGLYYLHRTWDGGTVEPHKA